MQTSGAAQKDVSIPKVNNFDILRLVLAWMVVFYHAALLSKAAQLAWVPTWSDGTVAVEGFFAISGCLITMSYDRNSNLKDYLIRRAERILPAYYAATVFVLVLGVLLTNLSLVKLLTSRRTLSFLAANVVFLGHIHPNLPGVYMGNPLTSAVNGALWTIKVEVLFYLFVPVFFYLCRRLGKPWVILGLCIGSVIYQAVLTRLGMVEYARQLPGQLSFFMIGAAVYFYYPIFRKYSAWMWGICVASILIYFAIHIFVFRIVGVSLATLCVGLLLPVFKGPTRYGDFSYGTYVLHYPLIQAFVALGLFTASAWAGMTACAVAVLILSVLSWNLVEKKFLRRQRVRRLTLEPIPITSQDAA